jgi:hypothetical protein
MLLVLRARRRQRTALAAALGELSQQINPMSAAAGAAAATWESIRGNEVPPANSDRRQTREHWTLVQAAVQPTRILISFAQVVGQLGQVLHVQYPQMLTQAIDCLRPLLADVWGMLVHLDCIGLGNAHQKFVLYVFVLPLFFLAGVMLLYLWRRRRSPSEAWAQLRSNLFVVIFLCYPTICNHAFGMFNCRRLSENLIVLEEDYSINCNEYRHHVFQVIAGLIIIVVAFGVPAGFTTAMLFLAKKLDESGATKITGTVAVQMEISKRKAADVIREVAIGKDYGFLLRAYGPRHYCFENFDMIRKLLLVGVLVVVSRGSVAQIICASVFSLGFIILHFKLWPYKISADNVFKAQVEVQIFMTIQIALVLKVDIEGLRGRPALDEVVDESFYDAALLVLFVLNVPIGFVCTVAIKMRDARRQRRRDPHG